MRWLVNWSRGISYLVPKNFKHLKWRVPEPHKAIFGVGFRLHKPYPYSLYDGEDSSILDTNEMFGDLVPI